MRVLTYNEADEVAACRTAFGEARGVVPMAELHVLWAIRNRCMLDLPFFGGASPFEVCHRPGQFSCWSLATWNSANLAAMLDLRVGSAEYATIAALFAGVSSGTEPDPTNGATYYYAPRSTLQPAWAKAQWKNGKLIVPAPEPCFQDVDHIFYSIMPDSRMIPPGGIP